MSASAMPAATNASCARVTTLPSCQSKPARRACIRPAGSSRTMHPAASTTSKRPPMWTAAVARSSPFSTRPSLVVPPPMSMLRMRESASYERLAAPEP